MLEGLPKYVFRGTTEGYNGNPSSNKNRVTSTSANPSKATLFAMVAAFRHGANGIVYIFETRSLAGIAINDGNCFSSYEEEVGFNVPPGELQKRSIGYIYVNEIRVELAKNNIIIKKSIAPELLSFELKEIDNLSGEVIEKVVDGLRNDLK